MSVAFCDGKFVPFDSLQVPFMDRGFQYGHGVFTTARLKNNSVENLERHLARLKGSCEVINILMPQIEKRWITDLVARNQAQKGVWRLKTIITGGASTRLDFGERSSGLLYMTLTPYPTPTSECLRIATIPYSNRSPFSRIKTLAYLDRLWIRETAKQRGFHDALATLDDGTVLEASASNVFWIHDGCLYTPNSELPLLSGTFLETVKIAAANIGLKVYTTNTKVSDIPHQALLYLCNAMTGIQPVGQLDSVPFLRNITFESELGNAIQHVLAQDLFNTC